VKIKNEASFYKQMLEQDIPLKKEKYF